MDSFFKKWFLHLTYKIEDSSTDENHYVCVFSCDYVDFHCYVSIDCVSIVSFTDRRAQKYHIISVLFVPGCFVLNLCEYMNVSYHKAFVMTLVKECRVKSLGGPLH